jgi:hypothetical protein
MMPTIWKIGIGTTWSTYQELKERHVVAQGWSGTGDLRNLFRQPEDTVANDPRIANLNGLGQRTLKNLLCHIIAEDLVIACEGKSVKGICEIGPDIAYGYDIDGKISRVDPKHFWPNGLCFEYANVLFPVDWVDWDDFNEVPGRQPPGTGGRGVLGIQRCKQDPVGILQAWTQFKGRPGPILGPRGTQGKHNAMNAIPELMSLLKTFPQIILNGPPGTSKTYEAKRLTARLLFPDHPEELIQEYFEQEKSGTGEFADKRFKILRRKNQSAEYQGQWAIVQFHPAYNYEDFVRGIQVSGQGDTIKYENVQRIFSAICTAAAKDAKNTYVLIIDEINRAHIAAVLGELIYGLEYRNAKITTPYAIEGDATLAVPDNLYVIGTMNTADRSIGHIDYAVRRRFAFVSCPPELAALESYYSKKEELRELAFQLFTVVSQIFKKENLNEFDADDVRPGHTYFMAEDASTLWNKFAYQVHPLLREYYKDGILKQAIKTLELSKGIQVPLDQTVSAETWREFFNTLQGTSA